MPSLANHQSNTLVKALMIGDSKAGKTTALVSLVKAGFKLRILDLDNLLDTLKQFILHECPDLIHNVEFRTLRDKRKAGAAGPVISGKPQAFRACLNMIDEWKYTDEASGESIDLGRPDEWGPDCILVIDSFSRLCDAAYDHYEPLVPRGAKGDIDARAVYGNAQDGAENVLAHITSETYRTNVLVIGHVQYMELPDKTTKGFPQGVGQKLSPKIPQYFSTVLLFTNKNGKRMIRTNSTPLVDLANPSPFELSAELDQMTGLAEVFATLRKAPEQSKPAVAPTKPAAVTLRRATATAR